MNKLLFDSIEILENKKIIDIMELMKNSNNQPDNGMVQQIGSVISVLSNGRILNNNIRSGSQEQHEEEKEFE